MTFRAAPARLTDLEARMKKRRAAALLASPLVIAPAFAANNPDYMTVSCGKDFAKECPGGRPAGSEAKNRKGKTQEEVADNDARGGIDFAVRIRSSWAEIYLRIAI
jgi:hypothetical protein